MERKEEGELEITLSRNATFADLFNALDEIEEKEGLGAVHFEEELWDNFDDAVASEVLLRSKELSNLKVLEYFRDKGYSIKDIEAYLPISFH